MPAVSVVPASPLDAAPRARALHERAFRHDGHDSLGEQIWRDLTAPGPDSAGFFAVDLGGDVGFAHVGRSDSGSSHWAAGLVVDPAHRRGGVATALLEAMLGHVRRAGGGTLVLWLFEPDDPTDAAVRACGFRPVRELIEMRVVLPLAEAPRWPPAVSVRTFQPGRDEDAWLAVNNRAFAGHPEQGGWTRATLDRREAEAWFDPSLFLLAFDARGLAGSIWMKQHPPRGRDPALGEIFVLGVDPRAKGLRLGRPLAVAGLAAVAARGADSGMLFVATDNVAANRLYRSLGFTEHRRDRAYECVA